MIDYSFTPEEVSVDLWSSELQGSWAVHSKVGIKVVHLPTGIVITSETARSQHQNRALAFDELEQRLAKLAAKSLTRLEEVIPERSYHLYWNNDVLLGNLDMDVDGEFYYWVAPANQGCVGVVALRAITAELEKLNNQFGVQYPRPT